MEKVLGVALLCLACFVLGGTGTYVYLLVDANNAWRTATEDARAKTAEALAAERRLTSAQTKRAQQGAVFEEKVSASALALCLTPADVQRMLAEAAESTRNRPSSGVPATRVQRPSS